MNEPESSTIDNQAGQKPNRFPILAQLGILGFIMLVLYGSWLLQPATEAEIVNEEQIIISDDEKYPIIPQMIENVSLNAEAAYVWDIKEQRALYTKNSETPLPLASITKLMTALLAYELVSGEETVSVPLTAIRQEGSSGLIEGENLELDALSALSLVSSSNDAAYAMGASVGSLLGNNDPMSQFVTGMNIRAEELGLYSLQFNNTTGLDESSTQPGSVGSAKDVSFLMEYIIRKYPEIISPTKKQEALIFNTSGEYHIAGNTNEVVMNIPNILGSKTGYTDLAGGNLTIVFDTGLDRPVVVTVLGSTREERFSDVMQLVRAVQDSLTEQQS